MNIEALQDNTSVDLKYKIIQYKIKHQLKNNIHIILFLFTS